MLADWIHLQMETYQSIGILVTYWGHSQSKLSLLNKYTWPPPVLNVFGGGTAGQPRVYPYIIVLYVDSGPALGITLRASKNSSEGFFGSIAETHGAVKV